MTELGPNQQKWIAALRSGKYRQGRDRLHKSDGTKCCLGVADTELGLETGDSYSLECTFMFLGLYDESGSFSDDADRWARTNEVDTLIGLNDKLQWSFAEIADFCEAHPNWVFERAA